MPLKHYFCQTIELENISKTFYRSKQPFLALDGVSLTVPKGKIFGVIGESGAGKSTLIRCVNLLERPSTGRVVVDGQDLTMLPPRQLAYSRQQIGMIFQHFNLLSSRTVFGNVAFPLELGGLSKPAIKQRVGELLDLVGLQEKAEDYPASLSGGQKQRVAIARTLANNPKVLLCDEATSALDPATTRSILALIRDINQRMGITVLLITHEMDVVKAICDEVAVISHGKLVEYGAIAEIFAKPKTDLAKQFINSALHIETPFVYRERMVDMPLPGKHPLLRLEISGSTAGKPVLSTLAKTLDMDFQIVSSQIDYAGGVKFKLMLIELLGPEASWQSAIEFIQKRQIAVSILGYV